MNLDPISIATKGYWCDTGPYEISIALKGYVCYVQNLIDLNAPRVYMRPVDALSIRAVPVAALIRPQTPLTVSGTVDVIWALPSLAPLVGPDATLILVDPVVSRSMRQRLEQVSVSQDTEEQIRQTSTDIEISADDEEEFQ